MRYRTKLLAAVIGLVILTGGVLTSLTYFQARSMVFDQIRATALSIATATAVQIDGDLHEQMQSPGQEDSSAYRELEQFLRTIRDAQRREDVHVAFIYTMRQTGADPETWGYVLDAEEEGEDKSYIGDAVEFDVIDGEVLPLSAALKTPHADKRFVIDEFGIFLSAQAPIRTANGDAVAVLGVDVHASDVVAKLDQLLAKALAALTLTMLAGVVLSVLLARTATRPLDTVKKGVDSIADGDLETRIELKRNDEFGSLAVAVNDMAKSLQERETLKEAFSRYVSRDMADSILESRSVPTLEGSRQRITVLFSDIRNFTEWSETLPPEDLVTQLNEYFSPMVEIVFRNRGTLDKFIGDGLMAIFGAPLKDEHQERHAVTAMLEMKKAVEELAEKWASEGKRPFQIGMGVHSGTAVVGNIGSEQRMDYTAVGRTVNIAARLEAQTKNYDTSGLISMETLNAIRDEFAFQEIGNIQLRGVSEAILVYTLPELGGSE